MSTGDFETFVARVLLISEILSQKLQKENSRFGFEVNYTVADPDFPEEGSSIYDIGQFSRKKLDLERVHVPFAPWFHQCYAYRI